MLMLIEYLGMRDCDATFEAAGNEFSGHIYLWGHTLRKLARYTYTERLSGVERFLHLA
jgi:hypothetical protein